jgi:hypothetical protein
MRGGAGLAIAIATIALLPGSAGAATYQVKACFNQPGAGWFGNEAWAPEPPNGFAISYSECPAAGMVSRMTGGSGNAPWGVRAGHGIAAPPDTRIVGFSGEVMVNELRGWYAGLADAEKPVWVWCGTGRCSTWGTYVPVDIDLDTTLLQAQVVCAGFCPRDKLDGIVAVRDAVVTIADNTQPTVEITGGLASPSGWLRGDQQVQFAARDNTGIREVEILVDGQERAEWLGHCSDLRTRPCEDAAAAREIPGDAFTIDGRHRIAIQAFDGAGNGVEVGREVWTDRTAPGKPMDLRLDGTSSWRATNRFSFRWTNPGQDAAPVAAAHYELCPGATRQGCVGGERRARNIEAVEGLQVPRPGDWRLSVWLEDAAGNHDRERSETVDGLRFDDAPPTLAFGPLNETHPTRVSVSAVDAVSGIAGAQIELRRSGEDLWRTLPTTLTPTGFEAVVDDEALPRGEYRLRAMARDHAGNERSADTRQNGEAATIQLPLRISTRVVVGRRTRVRAKGSHGTRYRTVLAVRPRAAYGRTTLLTGRVTTPGGNPLADVDLEVSELVGLPGAEWRPVATVRTGHKGRFRFKALRGPSRLLRFRYPGSRLVRGRSGVVDLRVRAASSVRVSSRSVVNGEEVTFRGLLRGGPVPAGGKLVQLQVFSRGNWLTFATRRTGPRGSWTYRYRFSATRGRVRYRFRAWVPKEAGYPYESGPSNRVAVTVRGL